MDHYEHTQPGTLILVSLLLVLALIGYLYLVTPAGHIATGLLFLVLAAAAFIFHSLTVRVTDAEVIVSFGPGVIRKTFPLADIVTARAVRNPWYFGWGIRVIPGGWMFNVSGLSAVELERFSGRKFRIGTDDPDGLLRAIRAARGLPG
ncbi:hypothetical protein JW905_02500 [bacterium]|nr:hypothetical protein [candidate division CSSED10-310 bacterium]